MSTETDPIEAYYAESSEAAPKRTLLDRITEPSEPALPTREKVVTSADYLPFDSRSESPEKPSKNLGRSLWDVFKESLLNRSKANLEREKGLAAKARANKSTRTETITENRQTGNQSINKGQDSRTRNDTNNVKSAKDLKSADQGGHRRVSNGSVRDHADRKSAEQKKKKNENSTRDHGGDTTSSKQDRSAKSDNSNRRSDSNTSKPSAQSQGSGSSKPSKPTGSSNGSPKPSTSQGQGGGSGTRQSAGGGSGPSKPSTGSGSGSGSSKPPQGQGSGSSKPSTSPGQGSGRTRPRTQNAREQGRDAGHLAGRAANQGPAFRDGAKDGSSGARRDGRRDKAQLDKERDAYRKAQDAPEEPVKEPVKESVKEPVVPPKPEKPPTVPEKKETGKPPWFDDVGPYPYMGEDNPKPEGPLYTYLGQERKLVDVLYPPNKTKETKPVKPVEVTGVSPNRVDLGENSGRRYMTISDTVNVRQLEQHTEAAAETATRKADTARLMAERASQVHARIVADLEAAQGNEVGDSLLSALQREAEQAEAQKHAAEEVEKQALHVAEQAKAFLAHVTECHRPIHQAVVDSPETAPAVLKWYREEGGFSE